MRSSSGDGFRESLEMGQRAAISLTHRLLKAEGVRPSEVLRLRAVLRDSGPVLIGAGAGLSTSAGFTYSGERFERYFSDFRGSLGIREMYSGGFYPFRDEGTKWAWWSRMIYCNRYTEPPRPVYEDLLSLVRGRDYFVITTNVDHQFQRAGFDKARLFYTQGDYGLFQSTDPSDRRTYDNAEWVKAAMEYQGFVKGPDGQYVMPPEGVKMSLPPELFPKTPDGKSVTTNLRADNSFVEDEGWHRASAAYSDFLRGHKKSEMLFLELGVGSNTPGIIKYPFWEMARRNVRSVYACINLGEAYCPSEIGERSICLDGDIGDVLGLLK